MASDSCPLEMVVSNCLERLDVLQEGMLLSKDNAPLSTSENNQNSENKLLSEILDAAQSLLKSIHQRHHIQTVNASRATAPVINASAIVIGRGLETLEKLSKEWIQTHSSWATTHSFLETLISLVESVSPREEAIEPKSFVRSMDAFLNAWIETKEELTKRYCGDSKYTKDSYPQLANSADTIISDGDFLAATVANDHFRSTLTSSKTRISLPPQYQSMALQMSQLVSGQSFTLSPVQISQLSTVISLQPICISYKILFEPLLNPLHSKSDGRSESWKRGRILLEHLSNGTHEIVIYKLTKRGKLVKALFQKADLNDKKYYKTQPTHRLKLAHATVQSACNARSKHTLSIRLVNGLTVSLEFDGQILMKEWMEGLTRLTQGSNVAGKASY